MFEAHFQTFDDSTSRAASAARVAALRAELKRRGLDGFIVPRADKHQGEYVPAADSRLSWLTGFTGSAGAAVVLADKAAIFVDGRYVLQVRDQIDTAVFAVEHLIDNPPEKWLETNLKAGAKFAYDPWLHTADGAERLAKSVASAGATPVPVESNPLDAVWPDRPAPPLGPVTVHDLKFAGETSADKLARIQADIGSAKNDALIVSDAHNVAWTFNIRGSDVEHTPLPLAFASIPREGRPSIYIDGRKLSNQTRDYLEALANVREPDALERDLKALGAAKAAVRVDSSTGADAISRLIGDAGGSVNRGADPITLMKSVKNATEIAGTHAAHVRDGVAVSNFLAWFDREAPAGKLTEIDAVAALETFRRETGLLKEVSFPTISGAGPNGAIVHYRVTTPTNRKIARDELFLLDSGAQYEDGTTDITRTIAVGTPSPEMRNRFTRVLKGHIAIARAVFPDGTTGAQLDPFARQHLWEAGIDFDHGTGHGVGSYLSVHEGPASISKRGTAVGLKRGMIISNEPGYYKAGAFGIRIENLVLVIEAQVEGAEKPVNAFETLTLAPIDRRVIEPGLMTADEIAWLDAYHARVAATLAPLVAADTRAWLADATQPLARG